MGLRGARALALLFCALGLCACAIPSAKASTKPVPTSIAPNTIVLEKGGTVTVAVPSLPGEFNPSTPAGASRVTAMVMSLVWPQPFVVDSAGDDVDAPSSGGLGLMTSAEVTSVDPLVVTYQLAHGARWSDGVPITASDFIYNWHEQVAYAGKLSPSVPSAGYRDIAAVTGSDAGMTVTVRFSKPFADWEALFANLVPAHVASRYGWVHAFSGFNASRVISGGPYEITRVVKGDELVLSPNPDYWGDKPRLAHLVFKVERTKADVLAALRSGTVDVAAVAPGPDVDRLVAAEPELNASTQASPVLWQLAFDEQHSPLDKVAVREALAKAIDRPQLAEVTIGESGSYDMISNNRLYIPGNSAAQRNDGAYETPEIDEAQSLLHGAGESLGADGLEHSDTGAPFVLDLVGPSHDPLASAIESDLRAQLLQAGIVLDVHNVPMASLLASVLPSEKYEIALAPYLISAETSLESTDYVPTAMPDNDMTASVLAGVVGSDVLDYSDRSVTALFSEASEQLNALDASGLYNEIDQKMWLAMPSLPLFQQPVELLSRDDVVNVSESPTSVGATWNAEYWAIQTNPPPTTTTPTPGTG